MPLLAIPFPHIDPIALEIGPFAIRWYALAYVAGILGGWWYSRRLVANAALWGDVRRPTLADMDDLIVWVALGIVLGGRIGYVLFYNFDSYLADPLEILTIWRGGMSFHGGFLGVVVVMAIFAKVKKLNLLSLLDLGAVVAPIGLFTGRIANFINGELWGRPAPDLPWGVVFPGAGPEPRHPSQFYEAFGEGLVLLLLLGLVARRVGFRKPGTLAALFAIGYGIARIVCEVFREPDEQLGFLFGGAFSAIGGITMGQVLSVPMVLAGLLLLWAARQGWTRRRAQGGDAAGDAAADPSPRT
ncbi:prolipoprotein diacylglyceryl transferase [Enterovirga rhinocerotis]|uniref:Phosphatidylglycerol--prolipoprotein diacylglyceryl transferase n=1 Tax=Enterovirga rhinocerotis TaxID=1339210 RepID=A0A4V3DXQ3_9HYPH|nr:prolipoprotein diacylglyceryl transferase [Enterovirga rhinocerotis]TDR89309.1 prolipoprotein diacylglyceryl transferase [Enterovirga rhinocerotis]